MMGQSNNKYGAWPIDPSKAEITWLPIAASQTLTKGDFVILSSKQVAIAVATSAELVGVIARDCASLTAGTLVPVYADPDTVFEVIANAASNACGPGDTYDIVGSTGAMMLNVSGTSYNVLLCRNSHPDDTLTSAYARWEVKINKHALENIST